jgi:hypothetical protein
MLKQTELKKRWDAICHEVVTHFNRLHKTKVQSYKEIPFDLGVRRVRDRFKKLFLDKPHANPDVMMYWFEYYYEKFSQESVALSIICNPEEWVHEFKMKVKVGQIRINLLVEEMDNLLEKLNQAETLETKAEIKHKLKQVRDQLFVLEYFPWKKNSSEINL